jgi:hypothetical protein
MLETRWPLVLVFAAGCGGTQFTAIPDGDGGDAETPDALVIVDGSVSDGNAPDGSAPDAAGDAGVTDSAASGDTGGPQADSGGHADAAGDSGIHDGSSSDAMDADAQDGDLDGGAPDAHADATDAADVADSADAPDAEACAPIVFFRDGDGDGYGGTTTAKGCVPPDSGAWVTTGGDCDDSNPTVSPGQTAYFTQGYTPTGKSTVSFDYNCDGQESEAAAPAKAQCGFVGLSCVGSGYLEASPVRSGGGVDPFCGSDQAVTCAVTNLVCQAGPAYTTSPVACH